MSPDLRQPDPPFAAFSVPTRNASSHGRGSGARAATPTFDTSAGKATFAPTGWKPRALDRSAMQATDYKRETAYFSALMSGALHSDDGTQAVLDSSRVGGVVIRGGFQPLSPSTRTITAPRPTATTCRSATPPKRIARSANAAR
ncbi:hypothetical protein [Gemmatimonas sp.]|uniref:hypothetical protein n=1 Tax=Gemmatimonas sp. TaxID=1962908 RepID=UPI0039830CF8